MLSRSFVGMKAPAVVQHNTLNANVSEFRPSTRQHDHPVNNSFGATGRDFSMTGTETPTRYETWVVLSTSSVQSPATTRTLTKS